MVPPAWELFGTSVAAMGPNASHGLRPSVCGLAGDSPTDQASRRRDPARRSQEARSSRYGIGVLGTIPPAGVSTVRPVPPPRKWQSEAACEVWCEVPAATRGLGRLLSPRPGVDDHTPQLVGLDRPAKGVGVGPAFERLRLPAPKSVPAHVPAGIAAGRLRFVMCATVHPSPPSSGESPARYRRDGRSEHAKAPVRNCTLTSAFGRAGDENRTRVLSLGS
jgi:hypothetical protein